VGVRRLESNTQLRYERPKSEPRRSPVEAVLSDAIEALILDLLEWIGAGPRPYSEVMDAWRTSCPRFPVWEDANDRGFIERSYEEGLGTFISVTALGREFLNKHRAGR
jgi:hypothetical protein